MSSSHLSHRRPTPVPTETAFIFGQEISQLPAIRESLPEEPEIFLEEDEMELEAEEKSNELAGTNSSAPPEELPAENDPTENVADEQAKLVGGSEEKTDSVKINISSHSLHNAETDSDNGRPSGTTFKNGYVLRAPEENVQEALLTLFFVIFHTAWSIGTGFWHLGLGNTTAAHLTFAVVLVSEICTQITYFSNRSIPKGRIWSTSKLLWIILLIPCTLPIFMALTNLIFAAKESKDHTYVRPWTNTRTIFLVESLSLAFPQSVLQTVLLMEDFEDFPSVKGAVIAAGLCILLCGITFARIRYDSAERIDRFASGTEKYIRYAVLLAAKVLWVITHACLIVSIRILYGKDNIGALILSIVLMQLFFEIPLLASTINVCQRFTGFLFSLFFLIPQFAALVTLILWVNVDMTVYKYNIGGAVLGIFFGMESLAIMGWLLDRCMGRDIDFFPVYPHLFGNLYLGCCK